MKILAIETSCDDTCVTVVKVKERKFPDFQILSNIISSQAKLHAKYGGVYPFLAKREHQHNLAPVLKKALEEARLLNSKCKMQNAKLFRFHREPSTKSGQFKIQNLNLNKTLSRKIDLIAVTVGPGLEPCLWTGINFAKELAKKLNLPVVPVNHIEAHILANTINNKQLTINNFPAVCLIVSGGHTQLILMKGFGKYKILGETRDDAAGECFDKVARILGLGYPGGPIIAKMATQFKILNLKSKIVKLPRPMIYQKNYDFSFSGLKTAVLYDFRSRPEKIRKSKEYIREMCKEVQQAAIDVLIHKTIKAAKEYQVKTIILGGGVVANEELRKQFKQECLNSKFKHLFPPKNLCTDNAAMVAVAAYFRFKISDLRFKNRQRSIEAQSNLRLK